MEKIDVTKDGIVSMRFNKPILKPNLRQDGVTDKSARRVLDSSISLDEFIEFKIKDADLDEELNKDMC